MGTYRFVSEFVLAVRVSFSSCGIIGLLVVVFEGCGEGASGTRDNRVWCCEYGTCWSDIRAVCGGGLLLFRISILLQYQAIPSYFSIGTL